MAISVQMPALGESVTEGTVTRWLKQEGFLDSPPYHARQCKRAAAQHRCDGKGTTEQLGESFRPGGSAIFAMDLRRDPAW